MIFDFLFPNRCLNCNQLIDKEEMICLPCMDKINFSNDDFLGNNILRQRTALQIPVEKAYALMYYEKDSLAQKIVHHLKYAKREKIGKILAEWATERIIFATGEKPDLLVSVPLHPKKLKQRGYNQLHLFGDQLSKFYNIPINHTLLKRTKHSKAQARKNQSERLKTENAYQLTEHISNKHILLIDDVYTTGNTIANIAWEIINHSQNVKISILVMAIDV